ncbi:ankyrin repeat domain-containing protein 26 isoform X4 [Paralichthys olivaceus]|uniref:ankyrin repeat domain-containing protein 26 isoform X4 n=1 Tax=Paralichthys olivaceus TaxID=8255 RepID=UPI003750015A
MKKIFSFTKKKKHPSGTPDSGSVLSLGYELKEKDLGKVHKAAWTGDVAKLKQLAKKNDINQLDKENRTALHIACASGHVEVVQFLLESKAKLNLCDNQNRSALMKAVQGQHERCVSMLLENHAEPNLVDINGNTALHLAANIPSISIAILLLQHEANINAPNKEGFTPLTVAVREDHIEMAEFLLNESADVNLLDQDQRSPLMIAAGNGQIGMLRLLLRFNADTTLKDTKGWSADDYAGMNGHHPCSHLIIEHGTQRSDGPSLSHQGLGKKKKKKALGSPFQDLEAGFSLGGPATDKDGNGANEAGGGFEDNSQSESLSRVSKSASDEWPSSEDDDELVLNKKKPQKVNLSRMIASKKGEADRVAEQGKSKDSEQPSSSKATSDSREGSPEAEDSEEEVGEEEEEEEEEDDDDDDDDDDEEEEEEEEDDEEEEEDDEESDEEDGEEDEEENENEEEDDDNCVAAVQANTSEYEDILKPSVAAALNITDSADSQKIPATDISYSDGTTPDNVDASEKDAKTDIQNTGLVCPVGSPSFAMLKTLNVEDDCVVSAIRVESKFSDEDDSLGKECIWSSGQNKTLHLGSTGGPMSSRPGTETLSHCKIKEEEFERELEKDDVDDDDSWSNKQNSGETVWKNSDNDEDNQTVGFGCNTVLANQKNILSEVCAENTHSASDAEDGTGLSEVLKEDKRRSSWGSSLEDSDADLSQEDEVKNEMLDQKSDFRGLDLQQEGLNEKSKLTKSNEDHVDTSWDSSSPMVPSSKCVSPKQMVEKPKSSTGVHPSKSRPGKASPDLSEWNSSSENDENDYGSCTKGKVVCGKVSKTNVTPNKTGEQHNSDGSWQGNTGSHKKETNDAPPAESPVPDNDNVDSILQNKRKLDLEKKKSDDSSWDDEDESDESEKQKTEDEVADSGDLLKMNLSTPAGVRSPKSRPSSTMDKKLEEETEVGNGHKNNEVVVGKDQSTENNRPQEEKLVTVIKSDPPRDEESSEDSDSLDQRLQYDFASATVKVSDVGDDSDNVLDGGEKSDDEHAARLTAYVQLQDKSAIVPETRVSSHNIDGEQHYEVTHDQGHDGKTFFDQVLPQTDIDDVDLDSPDEGERIGMGHFKNIEDCVSQKEDSTDNEDDDNEDDDNDDKEQVGEDEEDEDEGDMSDENDQPAESEESLGAASTVPETEKDKKRDFLSELGLQKGEEEQDSWDSESHSEDTNMPHEEKQSSFLRPTEPTQHQEVTSTADEANKENLFYIPSFLRGEGGSKMVALVPRRSVDRPRGSQAGNDANEKEHDTKEDITQKETGKPKWEPLSVLSKLEGDNDRKTDLMEELGLGDVDDLEDASDWDSASTTSKRTLPGRKMTSPGLDEFPECINPALNEQDEDVTAAAPPTPQRSISLTPHRLLPHPQPRARKLVPQKPESEEESDWEPENVAPSASTNTAKIDYQWQYTAEHQAVVKPDSPELSSMAGDRQGDKELDGPQHKEKDDTGDTCELGLNKAWLSGRVGENCNDLRDQPSPEGGGEDCPWEKRYEKLWVEVEKREVKSTFKNVAGELKEKFGELFQSRCSAEEAAEEEQATAESTSAEEGSSDEDEGEIIVRPAARARSTVLLTIPEQRESGLEDSLTESPGNSRCEDGMQLAQPPVSDSSMHQEPELLTDDALEESRSPSPHLTTAQRECYRDHASTAFTDGHIIRHIYDSNVDSSSFLKDETKHGPFHKQHLDLISKDQTADLQEAEVNNVEEDREEATKSYPPLISRHSASIPGVSDEELEEDLERFKLEVGMLKVVFMDLEKEKAQLLKEVGKEMTKTGAEVQKSNASRDTGGMTQEEADTEKPESRLGSLLRQTGAIQLEQQPAANKSTNEAPEQSHLPLQQSHSSNKQEEQTVEETLKLELVRGARHSRAPPTNTHVNGDPLSVFDDSTLSDVSDDEGRLTSRKQKNENAEEELAEDFDELTQSSDTATDDIDSPTSGYRHASVLIQKLDSATLDSRSMVKLQNIFHEYERSIQKARSRHGYLADKVSQLEVERAELKSTLEEVKDVKSALERNQLELQTEVTNLKFQLKQEQENRRNATMMYNTTRDKLRRTEEQHQLEVQERQKVELTLRNLELEMRTLVNNMKQLEEDHSETQRLLAQERSARMLQENLLNSHLHKQQEIEEENKRNISKSNEALSQLTEASDRERELLQQNATLQEQLTILRTDLERSQANSTLKESHILEENEALKEQLEDFRRDLKLNRDALTQTVFNCNNQVTTLKSELAMITTRLENERQTRETLEVEVESTRTRLVGAVKEAERCLAATAETEKALLREKEEHQRLKEKLTGEATTQRETVSCLSQKLAKSEACTNSLENEVHRGTLQLTEKGLLLDVLQREKDQATARVKELEAALQSERELVSRSKARQEVTQERLAQAQSEGMLMRQQLEEAQNKGVAKDRAVTDAQERFSDILSKLRSDCEERVQLVEERNKELASKAADLRDQIYKLEEEKNERETNLRQLQQELADSLKRLSMSEASLEVNTRYRNDLEEEKTRLFKDIDRLKGKLEESEDHHVQAERRINSLKSGLDEREKELTTAAQKLQEALSASAASDTTIKQLEEAVQRLEIENARLEAAAKLQSNKIGVLQKEAQEAVMVSNLFQLSDCSPGGGVRGHLEDLVTNLQSSKMTLEDQLNREVQKQSVLSHTAQDSQALWEEELKSRSKLGLRLAELEKEKGELNTQMEIEKKKAKKITEQKKAVDTRLDQEMKRNTELQKEMYRLRTLLKTAKKKLRDQDTGGAEFGSPMSSVRMELGRHSQAEGGFGRVKDKVDDLQVQLEKEATRRSQLEKVNGELKDQLASLKSFSHSTDQLERSKRQLEEEVLDLRRRMETAHMEQSQVEQYRRDTEERARQEIQQKLEQVNLFLQSQAASQEALDQIKATNEVNLRSQLEQKIRELEGELGRARNTQQDSLNQRDSTRTELERYRQLYAEELRLSKSLAAKLERANSRLTEANSKLLNERSRSLFASSIANGSLGSPSLDVGALGSPANYGATLGTLNRSLGLGLSLLSPVADAQNSRVEDYLAKMQSELDRNISKELNNATAELDVGSARLSPVGSVSRVELDPFSRATQQYLEVLKKNNMI